MPKVLVAVVISGNAAWTIASIALLFSGAVTPNLLGGGFVALQAVAVGALAELQYIGLRRSGGAGTLELERSLNAVTARPCPGIHVFARRNVMAATRLTHCPGRRPPSGIRPFSARAMARENWSRPGRRREAKLRRLTRP